MFQASDNRGSAYLARAARVGAPDLLLGKLGHDFPRESSERRKRAADIDNHYILDAARLKLLEPPDNLLRGADQCVGFSGSAHVFGRHRPARPAESWCLSGR